MPGYRHYSQKKNIFWKEITNQDAACVRILEA